MDKVLLTAFGVGGATIIGALIGFLFKNPSHKFNDIILSFAAGIMLAAAVFGLIIPSLEDGGDWGIVVTIAGILLGAVCLNLIDKLVPHLHKMAGIDQEAHPEKTAQLNKILLFVIAIAMHNLPAATVTACAIFSEPKLTPAAIPSGRLCIAIAMTNSKILFSCAVFSG